MRHYTVFVAIAALLLLLVLTLFVFHREAPVATGGIGAPNPSVMVGEEKVSVILATTDAQRAHGLSGTQPLKKNEGMLFVFTDDGPHRFWMKDMNYPIDIIWIDADGRIVSIVPSLSPDTYPHSYGPDTPSRYVLEVSAGFAAAHDVKVGDMVGL